jgi:S-adenosylmethionine:tRNA ribosyltransferase-isomerase
MLLNSFANINPSDFSYDLPENKIALFPVSVRDQSKLLIAPGDGVLSQDIFSNVADYLPAKSHLFFNNSRVIPARLCFTKNTGSIIEIFCLKPLEPADYALSLSTQQTCIWECMIGNLKRFNSKTLELNIQIDHDTIRLRAEKLSMEGNIAAIRFSWDQCNLSFAEILAFSGQIPLPPYIKRSVGEKDKERYQTIYSKPEGSVAAPTAGLHFTNDVFRKLQAKHIQCHEVTLHVGAGTFQPVKTELIADHKMHSEYFEISRPLVQLIAGLTEKIGCVGTTTIRSLESMYWLGVKLLYGEQPQNGHLHLDQWECYDLPDHLTVIKAFQALDQWLEKNNLSKSMASTQLIIVPRYRFRITDILITNFHQPGSTLLLLIAAFVGDSWRDAYNYALANDFRFLSYGDSSLLYRKRSD